MRIRLLVILSIMATLILYTEIHHKAIAQTVKVTPVKGQSFTPVKGLEPLHLPLKGFNLTNLQSASSISDIVIWAERSFQSDLVVHSVNDHFFLVIGSNYAGILDSDVYLFMKDYRRGYYEGELSWKLVYFKPRGYSPTARYDGSICTFFDKTSNTVIVTDRVGRQIFNIDVDKAVRILRSRRGRT